MSDEWQHVEYPKIRNKVKDEVEGEEFVVTEKVHGANFSFVTNGVEVRCARRRDFLKDEEKFYNYKRFHAQYEAAILRLFKRIRDERPVTFVHLYGELYGGAYPHRDVKRVATASTVQHVVYYSPDNHFSAFDVMITTTNDEQVFLSHDDMTRHLDACSIPYLPPLLITSNFAEALSFNLEFTTHIPAALGLPPLSPTIHANDNIPNPKNIAEGVVVKQRSGGGVDTRFVLKLKHPLFDETKAVKTTQVKAVMRATGSYFRVVMTAVEENVTATRVAAALSKVAEVDMSKGVKDNESLEAVVGEMVNDVEEEVKSSCSDAMTNLTPEQREKVRVVIEKKSRGAVISYLCSIERASA